MFVTRIAPCLLLLAVLGCGDDAGAASGGGGAGPTSGPTSGPTGSGSTASGEGGAGATSTSTGDGGAGSTGTTTGAGGGTGGAPPLGCEPWPAGSGTVVDVTPEQAGDLPGIAASAEPGTTLRLAPGTYPLSASIQLTKPGLALRSSTDQAADVVLDAGRSVNEAVVITASDVVVAHVTIARAVHHLVHVYPPGPGQDVLRPTLYGLRLVDSGQQFVKVNPIVGQLGWVDEGLLSCSDLELTDEGRPFVEPCCGGCYTGGIDVHAGLSWVVSDNRFTGIHCEGAGLPEHAVHFWKGSRDTRVERNTIIDCGRGIGLGLDGGAGERVYPDAPAGGAQLAHYEGLVRSNAIVSRIPWFDTGIEIHDASGPVVVHNSIFTTDETGFFSSIDYRFPNTSVVIAGNLTQRISQRDGASGDVHDNLEGATSDLFVDASGGDLHLSAEAASAIDQAPVLDDAGLDLDGESRDAGAGPDLGADERHAP